VPEITHQRGTRSELIAAAHLVNMGYYVFSPVVHQQGPIDIIAVNKKGDIFLIDAKTDSKRLNPNRNIPNRIYRTRSQLQKDLNVILAYVNKDNEITFVPDVINQNS
jgi:Holliday junction resolvase-like predicted endonuclease